METFPLFWLYNYF